MQLLIKLCKGMFLQVLEYHANEQSLRFRGGKGLISSSAGYPSSPLKLAFFPLSDVNLSSHCSCDAWKAFRSL
jgi:hypothetical protein